MLQLFYGQRIFDITLKIEKVLTVTVVKFFDLNLWSSFLTTNYNNIIINYINIITILTIII